VDVELVNLSRHGDPTATVSGATPVADSALVVTTSGPAPDCDLGSGSLADLRRAGAGVIRTAGTRDVVVRFEAAPQAGSLPGFVEGALLAAWRPPLLGGPASRRATVLRLVVHGQSAARAAALRAAVDRGRRVAQVGVRSRDLAATVSSVKTPTWLADQAVTVAAETGLDVEVWDEQGLARDGFGGLLAVGGGSASPPRLVQLSYRPEGPRRQGRPVVLVGKGITFDTGGLSIKATEAMLPMRTDMTGAGAVLAVMAACRELGVAVPVTALLPLAENAVSGSAYRPGDVVRHYGGRTTEVANTDAEGRMVLADALAYAEARLDPALLVDLATLTGAASLGLGRRHGALYSTDDDLAAQLLAAGRAAGEQLWRMPLVEDYAHGVESDIADGRQIAADPALGAGSIVAALFLRPFTGGRRWAHLDIAGPARADRDEFEVTKGATGFGARLLSYWLPTLNRSS
jgi:leucyl aminopeptidase